MTAKNNDNKEKWKPLRDLALETPYTMEYLSLMARRKQFQVKKIGRLWYSTIGAIREFEVEMEKRKEKRKERMRNSHYMKSKKTPVKLKVSQKTLVDQIQLELGEVLEEIREKERRLRDEYRGETPSEKVEIKFHTNPEISSEVAPDHGVFYSFSSDKVSKEELPLDKQKYIEKEKKETEQLSEKLIMDLGRLLNTANQIQDDVNTTYGEHKVSINNNPVGLHHPVAPTSDSEVVNDSHAPFLSLNYDSYGVSHQDYVEKARQRYPENYYKTEKGGQKWLKVLFYLIVGLIFFAITAFGLFAVYEM